MASSGVAFAALYGTFVIKHFLGDFLLQTQWMAVGKDCATGWLAPLAALQHAKEQSGTLAIPGASQITAAATVHAVGLRQRQTRRSLRSQRRSVPFPRRPTFADDPHR